MMFFNFFNNNNVKVVISKINHNFLLNYLLYFQTLPIFIITQYCEIVLVKFRIQNCIDGFYFHIWPPCIVLRTFTFLMRGLRYIKILIIDKQCTSLYSIYKKIVISFYFYNAEFSRCRYDKFISICPFAEKSF